MLLECDSYKSFLVEELGRRTRANPRYSQRAFARDLGLSPGELSEILTGRRPLTHKSAGKISEALRLSPAETLHLYRLVEARGPASAAGVPGREVSLEVFHLVSDWYCFAVLNLMDTTGFRWDAKWIAGRLDISVAEARLAMERLRNVGLVRVDGDEAKADRDHVFTPENIPSEAVRNYHKRMLELATQALEVQKVEDRDIAGAGFAVDTKHLPAIKREISQFLDHIVRKYSKGKKTAVYHLETALFRLTREVQS